MTDFLLDTCAVLWTAHDDPLREPAASELQDAYRRGAPLFVSPITAWEIAMLAAKGKIALALDSRALVPPLLRVASGNAGRDADNGADRISDPAGNAAARPCGSHHHRHGSRLRVRACDT